MMKFQKRKYKKPNTKTEPVQAQNRTKEKQIGFYSVAFV